MVATKNIQFEQFQNTLNATAFPKADKDYASFKAAVSSVTRINGPGTFRRAD